MKRSSWGITVVVVAIFLAVLVYLISTSEGKIFIGEWFGFRKVGPNLLVEKEMSSDEEQHTLAMIETGKKRVANLFGAVEGQPFIVIVAENPVLKKMGITIQTGETQATPLGIFVLIGNNGFNEDVISHELVHAEFAGRIGWYRFHRVPAWFHEGLATQADRRPVYSEEIWKQRTNNGQDVPDLNALGSFEQFENGDTRLHYIVAKHEVMDWLKIVGQKGLLEYIGKITSGEDSTLAYQQVKSLYLTK